MNKRWWCVGFLALLGGVAGWVYSVKWGCETGCWIRSNPYAMAAWSGIMAGLIGDSCWDYLMRRRSPPHIPTS